jgi:hypothetical protein
LQEKKLKTKKTIPLKNRRPLIEKEEEKVPKLVKPKNSEDINPDEKPTQSAFRPNTVYGNFQDYSLDDLDEKIKNKKKVESKKRKRRDMGKIRPNSSNFYFRR